MRDDPPRCPWVRWAIPTAAQRRQAPWFCCASHRLRYWGTGRKWLAQAVETGFISLDDLRRHPVEFFGRVEATGGAPEEGPEGEHRQGAKRHLSVTCTFPDTTP